MFKNHLKIAWRSVISNKLFSAINIVGLSLGLSLVMLLFLYIGHERSFDTMFPKMDRIYRVLVHTEGDFGFEVWATAPPATAGALKKEVTNIESAARLIKHNFGDVASLRISDRNFTEAFFYWADKELLAIFDVEILKGTAKNPLERPNTVILSQSAAKRYFSAQDPIGKTILVDNGKELEVTGVYRDFPENSTLDANILASSNGHWFYDNTSWSNSSFETYCLLKPQATQATAQAQINHMLNENVPKEEQWYTFSLQPMNKIHLYSSDYGNSYTSRIGDINEVRNLSYLAVLILLIACINYMNLTTAKSQKRAKEVGISKTLGAPKSVLAIRFYMETGLITAISVLIAIGCTTLVLPLFNDITGEALQVGSLFTVEFFGALFVIWILATLLSGGYPALYLSRFRPTEILSPSSKQGKGNVVVRKGLVVLQFAASAALIVGVLVIQGQTRFLQNKNLGFAPENVVAVNINGLRDAANANALVQEYANLAEVSAVAMAQGYPGVDVSGRTLRMNASDKNQLNIDTNVADGEILDVLQLKLLAGGSLPKNKNEKDTLVEVVLNKKAIDFLGYTPEEAIGKEVYIGVPQKIVGVVADFNYASLHQPIGAYAFHNNSGEGKSFMLVRFKTDQVGKTLEQLKRRFSTIVPNLDFSYTFLDQRLEKLYEREKRAGQISIVFCFLAIFVAALGLFGLATFMAEQRTKEIGVRKVLGASVFGITRLLSIDFIKLVLVSLVFAFPLAYWAMQNWLERFAYRIEISWWVFAVAGLAAVCIALLTVSFQAIKAATANPVKSLRTE